VGGAAVLHSARVFADVASAVADCSLVAGTTSIGHRQLEHPLHPLEAAAPILRGHSSNAALLFGSEKFGLSNEDLSYCHWLTRIPTVPETPSMNLGQAVAVCLYELVRDRDAAAGSNLRKPVGGADAEQLTRMLLELLEESGYTNRIVSNSTGLKVRRFLRRLSLQQRDARLLLGILRQLLWKLRE
jgi:tRNA/rRNA methyltransferase